MNTIERMKKRSDSFVKAMKKGSFFGQAKDEASEALWRASGLYCDGEAEEFINKIYDELVWNKEKDRNDGYRDIIAAAYFIEKLAETDTDILDCIYRSIELMDGDIEIVMDIFTELVEDEDSDLLESAFELETRSYRIWKITNGYVS